MLVKKYQQSGKQDKEILVTITKIVNSSINLRSKLKLIQDFLQTVNAACCCKIKHGKETKGTQHDTGHFNIALELAHYIA